MLEARRAGSGASGRNGGFALRGLAMPYDVVRMPDLMRFSEEALERLRVLAGDLFRPVGSLRVAVGDDELDSVRTESEALTADGFAVEPREVDEMPPVIQKPALGGNYHPGDGSLDQGAWLRRLAGLAHDAGAAIAEETRVLALEGTRVETDRGAVDADMVVVATNGYSDGLVPELDEAIAPARGQVLATEPIRERLIPYPIYTRWGYDYYHQRADGRLVVGGRRDTDLETEATRVEQTTDVVQAGLDELLRELVGDGVRVTHRWPGIMGFTQDWLPLVGPLPGREGVWVSAGYSGHGNVLGFACGEAVAGALLGRPDERLQAFSPGRTPAARPPA